MKLVILQENLSKAISHAERFVSTKAQLPVLSNILLKAEKGRLKLQATNLETGITLSLGVKVEEEGEITIPARIFSEFVNSLPKDKVKLELKDKTLLVSCGSYKASFNGIEANEFPPLPSGEGKKPDIVFAATDFFPSISKVSFAAAHDEGRPILTGVKFAPDGEKLILAATDGYRLSVKEIKKSKIKLSSPLIIPARSLLEVLKLAKEEEEISLSFTEKGNQAIFSFSDTEIITRLIEGEFPQYQKIIPSSFSTRLKTEKEPFLKALKVAAIFARDSANIVKFSLDGNLLTISANSPQIGENKTEVEVEVEGDSKDKKIAFNCRFLLEFLGNIEGESIIFEMSSSLNPGLFKIPEDSSFLHVIMPVRVQE